MKKKGIKKYLLGIEGAAAGGAAGASGAGAGGTAAGAGSFKDKAGAFMGNYGGVITSAASSLMPLLMKKPDPNAKPYKKGSKLIKYQEGTQKTIVADPNDPDNLHEYFKRRSKEAKKEAADLMRKYNEDNKNNPNIIGYIDDDQFNARGRELKNLTANNIANNTARAPITYSKNTFAGPSDEELKTGKIRFDAEQARKTYEDKQFKDSFQSDVLGKTIPKSKTVSTEKNPILYKEPVNKKAITYNRGDFNTFSAADKKKYRENIAKGVAFKIGDREYAAATPAEKAFSKRMEAKSNKPLIKKDSSTKNQDLLKNNNNPIQGQELVRMSRMGKDNFYTPGGLPIPIKRNYSQSTGEYQPVGLGEKFQEGTKKVSAKPTKQDYLDAAAKMTPAQRKQFHEMDAKGVKFKFGDLEYSGLQKGKGGSKGGNTPANTGNGAQTPPQNTGRTGVVINPNTGEEEPLHIFGSRFTVRPSTLGKAALRGFNVRTANPLMKIPALVGGGTASILDAIESLTPKGSTAEQYLKNASGIVDSGTTLLTQTPNVFKSGKMLWKGVTNPKESLKKVKEFYRNKVQIKPEFPGTPIGGRSGKLGTNRGFNQNPLQAI